MDFMNQSSRQAGERQALLEATENLINTMKSTTSYRNYRMQCDKIDKQPDLKQRVDEYRNRNFEIQNSTMSGEEISRKVLELQSEFSDILDDLVVTDFLAAELDFCRMVQNVNLKIVECLDFE